MRRGLAEYLEQLSLESPDGRIHRFVTVEPMYGILTKPKGWPSAAVLSGGDDGKFEPRDLGIKLSSADEMVVTVDPDGKLARGNWKLYAAIPADYQLSLQIEIECQDEPSRDWILCMLEEEFNPPGTSGTSPQAGITLELPHYHGVRASYGSSQSNRVEENGDNVKSNRWKAWFMVDVHCPQIRVVQKPWLRNTRIGIAVNTPDETAP